MFGLQVEPEPTFTMLQATSLIEDTTPFFEGEAETHEAKIGGRNYTFYLFEFVGKNLN